MVFESVWIMIDELNFLNCLIILKLTALDIEKSSKDLIEFFWKYTLCIEMSKDL